MHLINSLLLLSEIIPNIVNLPCKVNLGKIFNFLKFFGLRGLQIWKFMLPYQQYQGGTRLEPRSLVPSALDF